MRRTLLIALLSSVGSYSDAQTIIPNPGFESWGTQSGEDPQPLGWISYNVFTSPAVPGGNSNPTSVTQAGTPDNYQGNYSAKITTVSLVANPNSAVIANTAGWLYTGSAALSSPYLFPGYASQQRPQTLTYYAKYTPAGTDSAFAIVMVSHWNGTSRDTIALGYDLISSGIANYTMRTASLIYNPTFVNTIPDSIFVGFSSSSLASPQVGSALWVDAVSFQGYVGMEEQLPSNGISVYPNPSSTLMHFEVITDNASYVIAFDMTGREIVRERFNGKAALLNSSELANGSYSYTIISNESEVLGRGQFGVAH